MKTTWLSLFIAAALSPSAPSAPSAASVDDEPFDLLLSGGRFIEGVVHVLVGGDSAVKDGQIPWALPGKVITPEEGRKPPIFLPAATN